MSTIAKLKARHQAGYGMAEAGIIGVEVLIQLYLLKFYISEVKLEPSMAGAALALAVIWDGLTDPVMGTISDHSTSKLGRRRKFILLGTFLLALVFPLLFFNPGFDSQWAKFFYLLLTYLTVNTAMTIIAVPHAALGGELTTDSHERTKSYGYRLLFGNVGFLLGTLVPGFFLSRAATQNSDGQPRVEAAIAMSAAVIVTGLVTYFTTGSFDRPRMIEKVKTGLRQFLVKFLRASLSTIKNPVFLPLLVAYFVATIGRTLNSSIALYYYEHFLKLSEEDTIFYILGAFVAVICLSIVFWVLLSKVFGKKWPAFWGIFLLGLGTMMAYPNFPAGSLTGPLFAAVIGGLLVGSIVLFDSLVADIVDYDEMKTRERRDGLYFGFWKLSAKASRAVGLALSGWLLGVIGYDQNLATQTPQVSDSLALIFGPGVGSLFVLAAIIFTFIPWSDKTHKRIETILKRRKQA